MTKRPKRKRYLCNLCSFKTDDRDEIEAHIDTYRRLKKEAS